MVRELLLLPLTHRPAVAQKRPRRRSATIIGPEHYSNLKLSGTKPCGENGEHVERDHTGFRCGSSLAHGGLPIPKEERTPARNPQVMRPVLPKSTPVMDSSRHGDHPRLGRVHRTSVGAWNHGGNTIFSLPWHDSGFLRKLQALDDRAFSVKRDAASGQRPCFLYTGRGSWALGSNNS